MKTFFFSLFSSPKLQPHPSEVDQVIAVKQHQQLELQQKQMTQQHESQQKQISQQPLSVSQSVSAVKKISPVRQQSIEQATRRLSKTLEQTLESGTLTENKENINVVLPLKSSNDTHYIKNKTMQSPVNKKKVKLCR